MSHTAAVTHKQLESMLFYLPAVLFYLAAMLFYLPAVLLYLGTMTQILQIMMFLGRTDVICLLAFLHRGRLDKLVISWKWS